MTKDVETIYEKLRSEIIELKIAPGDWLKEEAVSARFGLSRTPIRDVLKRLEFDGLLTVRPQSGSYVTKIDLSDISDTIYIRAAVEYSVLQTLMGVVNPCDLAEVMLLLSKQRETLSQQSETGEDFTDYYFRADNAFHTLLFKKAGKEHVLERLNSENPVFQRYRYLTFLRGNEEIEGLYRIHTKIVRALELKDDDNLRAVVNEHNFAGLNGIKSVQERHPDWFI